MASAPRKHRAEPYRDADSAGFVRGLKPPLPSRSTSCCKLLILPFAPGFSILAATPRRQCRCLLPCYSPG